jgi:tetratricopeptide (TPR) repeat protein
MTRLAIVLALMLGGTAWAQQAKPAPDYEAAKKHYLSAREALAAGQHDDAVKHYLAAYDITKDPSLFRQVGQAYEAAGKRGDAAIYYRRFLTEQPNASDAKELQARIAQLEGPGPAPTPEPAEPLPTEPLPKPPEDPILRQDPAPAPSFISEPTRWQRTAAWVSVGVAAVFLTTGGVLATSAASREEDLHRLIDARGPDGRPLEYMGLVREDYEDKLSEGDSLDKLAIYSFVAAGVAVTAATLFFILDASAAPKEKKTARRIIVPIVTPESAGVSAAWSF